MIKKNNHLAVSDEVYRYIMRTVAGKNTYFCVDDFLRDRFGMKRER